MTLIKHRTYSLLIQSEIVPCILTFLLKITQEEKDEIREELHSSTSKVSNVDLAEFYKVPFQKVADLIRLRKVYLSQGMAYIPNTDLVSLFVSYFRQNLVEGLEVSFFLPSR